MNFSLMASSGAHDPPDHPQELMWAALRAWLESDPTGQKILADLLHEPTAAAAALIAWLQQRQAPAQLAVFVQDATVGKIVQIAQARDVYIDAYEPAATIPTQLPADLADFTGREPELLRVQAALIDGRHEGPVVISAIDGKGGVGKTVLALRAAHSLRSNFPDGQLYVNLRGAEARPIASTEVLAQFLRALGVDGGTIPASLEERAAMFRDRAGDRRLLVLLDNAATEEQIRPLVPGTGSCAVLITSRMRLGALAGARVLSLDVMTEAEAVELLTRLIGDTRAGTHPGALREIAARCGFLPLAVRIAGARLAGKTHWSLEDFARRLSDEKHRLNELRLGDLEVRASFALSYRSQPAPQRRAFRLLGVMDMAQFPLWAVAAALAIDLPAAERIVEDLVDAQLLEVRERVHSGEIRFGFHDLMRDFARERMGSEETRRAQKAALTRILSAYLILSELADAGLEPADVGRVGGRAHRSDVTPPETLAIIGSEPQAWFDAEHANMVTAVAQAHSVELWDMTWELAATLPGFYQLRSYWSQWRSTHQLALNAARQAHNAAGEAHTLRNLARLSWDTGQWSDAVIYLKAALQIFRRLGERRWTAIVQRDLGRVHWEQSRWDDAVDCLVRALPVFTELGDTRWEALTLRELGRVYTDQGRWDDAISCLNRCLTISSVHRDPYDRHRRSTVMRELARVHAGQGQLDKAIGYLEEARPVFQELRDRRWETIILRELGHVYREQSRWDDAIITLQECLSLLKELSDKLWEGRVLAELAIVHAERGTWNVSNDYFSAALPILGSQQDRLWEAYTRTELGRACGIQGQYAASITHLNAALPLYQQLSDRLNEARALADLADLYQAQGDVKNAVNCLSSCLPVLIEFHDDRWLAKARRTQAILDGRQG